MWLAFYAEYFLRTIITVAPWNIFIKYFSNEYFFKNFNRNWFLPVWVLLWILRFSDLANTLLQPGKGQGNGFSPVWTLIWLTNLYLALNGRPERGQPDQKHAWLDISGPPTCSMVMWDTISGMELKVWNTTSYWILKSSCLQTNGAYGRWLYAIIFVIWALH